MLTGPLLIARFRKGKAYPYQLKIEPASLKLASSLIEIFKSLAQHKRSEIEEEVKNLGFDNINPKVPQGLARILFKRSDFSAGEGENPADVREKIFSASAEYWRRGPSAISSLTEPKENILRSLGVEDQDKIRDVESWLFADISGNQRLMSFEDISSEDLIHRFNIEQVQGLLFNVVKLELKTSVLDNAGFRQLMWMMKFFRLMFEVKKADSKNIVLSIDGPKSILENSRSYGAQIAQFFPAILLLPPPWQISASLKLIKPGGKCLLEITDQNPYKTFYRKKGVWTREKATALINRFNQKYAETHEAKSEQRIISLKNNLYLLPDFIIQKKTGKRGRRKEFMIEWIHYFSDSKLKWMKKIASELPKNYILAIKGKRSKLQGLIDLLGKKLLVFSGELTAPAIKKRLDEY